MDVLQARHKLEAIGQPHVLAHWEGLSEHEKYALLSQIKALDPRMLRFQQQLLQTPLAAPLDALQPFGDCAHAHAIADVQPGKEMIAAGQLGCLIVAGGQGTRLRFDGPKGMFPVSPVKHKSLFQLFAEKTIAAGKQAGRRLPLAIMTSPLNHAETVAFFKQHDNFGLASDQLSIFPQGMLPFLNTEGALFLEDPHTIAEGPDGNGAALHHFYTQGIWEQWKHQGVRYVNFVLIDNPLCDPYDATLLTYQAQQHSDLTIKCTERRHPEEKVGILARQAGKAVVVEYTEMPAAQRHALAEDGTLLYPCANLSLFCFRMDFIEKVANLPVEALPLHRAFKAAKALNGHAAQQQQMAWKFEKFIFDVLPLADKVSALLYPRQECFAPLKNFAGDDSIDTVKQALQAYDRALFAKITGHPCDTTPFELAQAFHYPTEALLSAWRNRPAPYEHYVDA